MLSLICLKCIIPCLNIVRNQQLFLFLLINEFCHSSQFSPVLVVLNGSVVFTSTSILSELR